MDKEPSREEKKRDDDSIGRRIEDFKEEAMDLGSRIEKEAERIGERAEVIGRRYLDWYDRTFGVTGAVFISILGLVILLLIIQVTDIVDNPVSKGLSNFLSHYIVWLFVFILFFSFTSYISRRYTDVARFVSPILSAIGFFIGIWVLIRILDVINTGLGGIPLLGLVTSTLDKVLVILVVIVLVVGYIGLLYSYTIRRVTPSRGSVVSEGDKTDTGYKRLYRSGKERIIGGVCGGIGEYLGIDPVIVRLVWVIGVFITAGVLLLVYLVFWVITPRNPSHEWRR